jgi:hypothetical protein
MSRTRLVLAVTCALAICPGSLGSSHAQARSTITPIAPLRFLVGTWDSAGGGAPGQANGTATFAPGLQDRVLIRTSFAEYPAAGDRPASRHDDLMVIYAVNDKDLRADYYDSEGHVIRYAVRSPGAGRASFLSDALPDAPRYRLTYDLRADGVLAGSFEVAPPGQPGAFTSYLTWESRKRR